MLDPMQMSMIHPEYQYRAFIAKSITPNINFDFRDLVEFIIGTKGGFWVKFFYAAGSILSLLLFLGYLYCTYTQKLGWGIVVLGVIALISGIGMSGGNAKLRHIIYFIIAYGICKYFDISIYPLILWISVWCISWFSSFMTLKIVFNKLKNNKELFLLCVQNGYIAVYFDDNNQKEGEKFKQLEGIDNIPVDHELINRITGA